MLKKISHFIFSLIVILTFKACNTGLSFPGIDIPLNNQMILELDGRKMSTLDVSAMVVNENSRSGVSIRSNFREGDAWSQIIMGLIVNDGYLDTKYYRFKGDCSGKKVCGKVVLYTNMLDVKPNNIFASALPKGESIFKITGLDFKPGGYIAGYFAAAVAGPPVRGKAINNGRFRIKLTEKLTN